MNIKDALDVADGKVHFSQMDCDLAGKARSEALTVLAAEVRRLQRFREREPLVQELIAYVCPSDPGANDRDELPKYWRGFLYGLDERVIKLGDFVLAEPSGDRDE